MKKIIIILFLSFFYPQWAMWGNPSLPVGSADKGIGLGAGEIMITADYAFYHIDWEHFPNLDNYCKTTFKNNFHLLTTKSNKSYTERVYRKNDFLIFGSETAGISDSILHAHPDNMCTIPMKNENIRSLNLATSVGIVLYEALRQING